MCKNCYIKQYTEAYGSVKSFCSYILSVAVMAHVPVENYHLLFSHGPLFPFPILMEN